MTEEKKKGFLSKLFGAPKSSCCNVQIEEVEEEEGNALERHETGDKPPKK